MGGTPKEAIISIAIPDTISLADLDALYAGMKSMAKEFMVNLLGGDTTSSPEHLVISVAVVGEAVEDEILFRSGAMVGEVVFLTGPVGSSAAGLDIILKARQIQGWGELIDAHNDPYPAVKAGRIIAKSKLASALIDVSDGVAADLGHVCAESNVGAILEFKAIPNTELFRRYCETFSEDPTHMSLHVGEDYVLLGTVPAEAAKDLRESLESNGCEFYPIGHTIKGTGLRIKAEDGSLKMIETRGWNHFK
jgi:thiamine-monophosphate kinase